MSFLAVFSTLFCVSTAEDSLGGLLCVSAKGGSVAGAVLFLVEDSSSEVFWALFCETGDDWFSFCGAFVGIWTKSAALIKASEALW